MLFVSITALVLSLLSLLGLGLMAVLVLNDHDHRLYVLERAPQERVTEFRAEIEAVKAAMDTHRAHMRSQLGSINKRLGLAMGPTVVEGAVEPVPHQGGDFEALMALQSAPPVKPS